MRLKSDIQDVFTPDPGFEEPVECGVCGATMIAHRDQYGPTSSIMAMSGSKRHYDFFECPHRQEEWHKKVIELREFKRKVPSAILCAVLEWEINLVLENKWKESKGLDPEGQIWLTPKMLEAAEEIAAMLNGNTSGISTERPG